MSVTGPSQIPNLPRRKRPIAATPAEGLPLMTRAQLVQFLNANGFPISESTLSKLCSPKINRGPPISKWWGKRPLHAPEPSLAWARALLRNGPTDIAAPSA
jgi:hypothetical protein